MKIHRFLLAQSDLVKSDDLFEVVEPKTVHQMVHVLRLEEGERVEVFGNDKAALYSIETIVKAKKDPKVFLKYKSDIALRIPEKHIGVAFGISKKDTAEWIVQKCTELGVSDFYPLITDRTEKKNVPEERLQIIIKEAVEQSGWHTVPTLHPVQAFEEFMGSRKGDIWLLDGAGSETIQSGVDNVTIVIGPEGGFTEREVAKTKEAGWSLKKLGNSTLRAETAAVSAAALLLL
ncbi:MAG TPA: RsmE family RNA methyltransferase [Candidatus Paceibacterota bacterium]|nr:RsmE family RNA methyltransferase [Candidatus Paceibacterota bacterium]